MKRAWWIASMTALASWSCGARTDLDPETESGEPAGAGGSTVASSSGAQSTTSTMASSGGSGTACERFAIDSGVVSLPPFARSPQLTAQDETLRVTWHTGRFVDSQLLAPETRWPEPFESTEQHVHIGDFGSYLVASSAPAPIFLHTESGIDLELSGAGGAVDPVPAASPGELPLFLARSGDRYLYASSDGAIAGVGSYRVGDLPQSQGVDLCLSTPPRGAAVASGDGFLAVIADASSPGTSCLASVPPPATSVVSMRFRPSASPTLTSTTEAVLPQVEPLQHVDLAATPTGAWLTFQTDGSTSRVAPPIMAARLTREGALDGPVLPVTGEGISTSVLATTHLDEALVFAHTDMGVGGLVIRARRVERDGTLGAGTRIDLETSAPPDTLRLMSTADQRSVIVVWGTSGAISAMAKLDCVP